MYSLREKKSEIKDKGIIIFYIIKMYLEMKRKKEKYENCNIIELSCECLQRVLMILIYKTEQNYRNIYNIYIVIADIYI